MSQKIDNLTLAQIVDDCAMFSIDERLTPSQQAMFGEAAELLRAQLTFLLTKTFNDGTPALVDANAKIKTVNARLKAFAEEIANAANTLESVSKLISVLDGLAKIPLGVI
jgi:hypothetical protein